MEKDLTFTGLELEHDKVGRASLRNICTAAGKDRLDCGGRVLENTRVLLHQRPVLLVLSAFGRCCWAPDLET